jgi:hypothetical protein
LDTKDEPTSDDWLYSDFIKNQEEGAEWDRPVIYRDKDVMKVWDQFDQNTTYKGCTAYWLTSPYNWYNVREWAKSGLEYEQENPRWKWEAYQATRWRPNVWSSLQKILKFFRDRKLIDGSVTAVWVSECKNALDNWFYLYSGSKYCNRRKSWASGKFVYNRKWGWHAFAIVDYNDEWFIAINSFGDDRGDKGYFIIPFDDFKYLYSCNVIIDHDNTGSLQTMRDDCDIQKAIEMGITNGSDLESFAIKRDIVLMLVRWLRLK